VPSENKLHSGTSWQRKLTVVFEVARWSVLSPKAEIRTRSPNRKLDVGVVPDTMSGLNPNDAGLISAFEVTTDSYWGQISSDFLNQNYLASTALPVATG
jgi:hypothetical protein